MNVCRQRRIIAIAAGLAYLIIVLALLLGVYTSEPIGNTGGTVSLNFLTYTNDARGRSCASCVLSNSTPLKIQIVVAMVIPHEHGPSVTTGQILNQRTVLYPGRTFILSPLIPKERSTFQVIYSDYDVRNDLLLFAQRMHLLRLCPNSWKQSRGVAHLVNTEIPAQ